MIADDGHVATVAVDPAWQRRGIGRCLLGELVTGALALGANQLTLEVRVTNHGAQDLYGASRSPPQVPARRTTPTTTRTPWSCGPTTSAATRTQARLESLARTSPTTVVRQGFDVGPAAPPVPHPALSLQEHA